MALSIWEFFNVSEKDNKTAICNMCEAEISRGETQQSISYFEPRHLRTPLHSDEYCRGVKGWADFQKHGDVYIYKEKLARDA